MRWAYFLWHLNLYFLLSYEVNKPSKILIKKFSAAEYIKSYIQNIEAPRKDDPIIYHVWENILIRFFLREFLKLFRCLSSRKIYMIFGWFDLLNKM